LMLARLIHGGHLSALYVPCSPRKFRQAIRHTFSSSPYARVSLIYHHGQPFPPPPPFAPHGRAARCFYITLYYLRGRVRCEQCVGATAIPRTTTNVTATIRLGASPLPRSPITHRHHRNRTTPLLGHHSHNVPFCLFLPQNLCGGLNHVRHVTSEARDPAWPWIRWVGALLPPPPPFTSPRLA